MAIYKFIERIDKILDESWQSGTSKNYIWDEIAYAEYLLEKGKYVNNHIFKDVFLMAKYFHHVKDLDDTTIKTRLIEFFGIDRFTMDAQMRFREMIDGAIKGSKKQFMKVCHEIKITQNEMNVINNMADTTTRKIAFVLLCMWKANGNKPFRTTIHQAAREIGIKANGKKLSEIYFSLKIDKHIYIYNRTVEKRKRILEKLVETDSQYGQIFIPYDAFKYEQHLLYPTRKSAIALWRWEQDYYEQPFIRLPEYYIDMSNEEKEKFKEIRYHVDEEDMYGDDELDRFYESTSLEYIKENIDHIARCYMRDDFARLIGGEVFYSENGAHNKIKVLFAESDSSKGILIDVNGLHEEFEQLFGDNKTKYGNCNECGLRIIKKSNKTKYCDECKVKVRNEKVKINMRNLRSKQKLVIK